MRKLSFTFLTLFNVIVANAQITFQKTYGGIYGDFGHSVQQTPDGGFIIAGNSNYLGATDPRKIFVLRINSIGDTLWTETFEVAISIVFWSGQQTMDGGYVVTSSTVDSAGQFDLCLHKTDLNGNLLWAKIFSNAYEIQGNFVQQTADGGYIITGYTRSFLGSPLGDVLLIKTDANGDSLWTKTYSGIIQGGQGNCVRQTADGGYVILGNTGSNLSGYYDVCLIKTDSIGNPLWAKSFGGYDMDKGNSIQLTTDGGYIITGNTENFGGSNNKLYLLKSDANGNISWFKIFDNLLDSYGKSVQQTSDGGYVIIGAVKDSLTDRDIYLIKTDVNGDSLWTRTYGGIAYDIADAVQETSDGGYVICGTSTSFGAGYYDVYIIKTDSLGISGCNQRSRPAIITTPTILSTNFTTTASSPIISVTTPSLLISGGCIVSDPCIVGINEAIFNNSFLISPNPTNNNFTVSFEKMIFHGSIEILDMCGKIILSENISSQSNKEIRLNDISSGIYIVRIKDGPKTYSKKLIVVQD